MPQYIAFLRAINVGGHIVKMDALQREFESLGFSDVETFIASGNVIFSTKLTNASALEAKIENRLAASLAYDIATFLRTPAEIASIAMYKPFADRAIKSAGAFCVGFVKSPLTAQASRALAALKSDLDDFHTNGREVYWLCKVKQSESKFSNAVFERKVGMTATFRGMSTIQRLAAKVSKR